MRQAGTCPKWRFHHKILSNLRAPSSAHSRLRRPSATHASETKHCSCTRCDCLDTRRASACGACTVLASQEPSSSKGRHTERLMPRIVHARALGGCGGSALAVRLRVSTYLAGRAHVSDRVRRSSSPRARALRAPPCVWASVSGGSRVTHNTTQSTMDASSAQQEARVEVMGESVESGIFMSGW